MSPSKIPEKSEIKVELEAPADPLSKAPAESAPPTAAEELRTLRTEKEDLMKTLIRLQADFENYRKRIERERHQERHRGAETLVESLLPVLDAFDRAIAAHDDPGYEEYRKGFELIRKHLWDVLAKSGLERIEASGERFNPRFHHAVERIESRDYPDGEILEELQAGYMFHDKVLRPAMVRVAIHPPDASAEADSEVN